MKRYKPFVYKKCGYWWVLWNNTPYTQLNSCFDIAYNEAQRFANKVSVLA